MVRARRSGLGAVVALAVAGCSLITPLDFVGGSATGSGGRGGASGSGGTTGGRGGAGGTNPEGGMGEGAMGNVAGGGASGRGAGGTAGKGGTAGTGGDPEGGDAGDAGEGGMGQGGSAGAGGAGAGGAGKGGASGLGGSSGGKAGDTGAGTSGGGGCAGADLGSDPLHCGACGTTCGAEDYCIDGACVSSPCDGLCETFTSVPLENDGYRMDLIGNGEACFEVVGYVRTMSAPQIICWEFVPGRVLEVNGTVTACNPGGVAPGAERAGGYCVKAGAGDHDYAGFKFPLP
jgi:hypothetical protein